MKLTAASDATTRISLQEDAPSGRPVRKRATDPLHRPTLERVGASAERAGGERAETSERTGCSEVGSASDPQERRRHARECDQSRDPAGDDALARGPLCADDVARSDDEPREAVATHDERR